MKTCPMGAELFHGDRQTDGRTDRHDEYFRDLAKASQKVLDTQFITVETTADTW